MNNQERIVKVNTAQAKTVFMDRLFSLIKTNDNLLLFADAVAELLEYSDNEDIENSIVKLADLLFGKD